MSLSRIVAILITVVASPVAEAQNLSAWKDILSFRPSKAVQEAVQKRGDTWTIHRMEDAAGRVNLDYYPVVTRKLPNVDGAILSAVQMLEYVRRHINDFVDTDLADFQPFQER
jgi:hypothetical protein